MQGGKQPRVWRGAHVVSLRSRKEQKENTTALDSVVLAGFRERPSSPSAVSLSQVTHRAGAEFRGLAQPRAGLGGGVSFTAKSHHTGPSHSPSS